MLAYRVILDLLVWPYDIFDPIQEVVCASIDAGVRESSAFLAKRGDTINCIHAGNIWVILLHWATRVPLIFFTKHQKKFVIIAHSRARFEIFKMLHVPHKCP